MITPLMIVAALETVPEKHLKIIDLAWKYLKEDGTLDDDKIALNYKEISQAMDEANAYQRENAKTLALILELAKGK